MPNQTKPHILITNDDGIEAIGLHHLVNALKDRFHITVIAPKIEQSGKGAAVTLNEPLTVAKATLPHDVEAWSVTGTPADCVRLGISVILRKDPDLIVSGINRGSNHGRTVLYSGTIGGVIEGALRGIPGVAFSSYNYEDPEYKVFENYIPKIIDYILAHPMPFGTLMNVNFPNIDKGGNQTIYGIKMTSQGKQYWREDLDTIPEHRGEGSYFIGSNLSKCQELEHSDTYWLDRGWITSVPIHVDELTDWRYIRYQKESFDHIFDV